MIKCPECNEPKELEDFYETGGGKRSTTRCKECVKQRVRERHAKNMLNPDYVARKRSRGRGKYRRLNYKETKKPSFEERKLVLKKYKQKRPYVIKAQAAVQRKKHSIEGYHWHHWSYIESNWKDVIEISPKNHAIVHRYLVLDEDLKLYRTSKGDLLDTKEKHEEYINIILTKITK